MKAFCFRCSFAPIVIWFFLSLIVANAGFSQSTPVSTNTRRSDVLDKRKVDERKEEDQKPYKLSTRIHLEQGGNKGYLVVKVELNPDFFVYALTQSGEAPPTKLSLGETKQFKLAGKFTPDVSPKIVTDEFLGRVEKHAKEVQFFAPIELAPGVDSSDLKYELSFKGQVCGDSSCMPVKEKLVGKFAGHFKRPKK